MPQSQKDLLKWLCLSIYLHTYNAAYADMARRLFSLLMKNIKWCWHVANDTGVKAIKKKILSALILALPEPDRLFSVVCDASEMSNDPT